jgi:hypothetical protein
MMRTRWLSFALAAAGAAMTLPATAQEIPDSEFPFRAIPRIETLDTIGVRRLPLDSLRQLLSSRRAIGRSELTCPMPVSRPDSLSTVPIPLARLAPNSAVKIPVDRTSCRSTMWQGQRER